MTQKNYKRGFSWKSDLLKLGDGISQGNGMFATSKIPKGTLIMIYGGHVMSRTEEDKLPELIRDIAIQIDKGFVIGVRKEEELGEADFVNHSCDPNTGIKGQISLTTMRDINVGEEITFDYGTVLYRNENDPIYELDCLCGQESCRGKITQYDWMKPELQQKYKGFFPYYIQEEISNLSK